MKIQTVRKIVQAGALGLLVLVPVLESYNRLLYYLSYDYIGMLWASFYEFSEYTPDFLKGGYFSGLVVVIDYVLGNLGVEPDTIRNVLSLFGGSFWSITIGGMTILDPLAFFQAAASLAFLTPQALLALFIPVVLALLMGRVFCGWICPVNTIFELSSFVRRKLGIHYLNKNIITSRYLRYVILVIGIVLPLAGVAVFPYLLPYALLGRVFYYLTTGVVFWYGISFIGVIIFINTFVQKGFWCNYLCPAGAFLSLIGRLRLFKLKHYPDACRENCSLCKQVCNWNANPKMKDLANCTNCGLCVSKCPNKALRFK